MIKLCIENTHFEQHNFFRQILSLMILYESRNPVLYRANQREKRSSPLKCQNSLDNKEMTSANVYDLMVNMFESTLKFN